MLYTPGPGSLVELEAVLADGEPPVVTQSDVERYLARLGVPASVLPTAGALRELTRAHVSHVPFENLLIQVLRWA